MRMGAPCKNLFTGRKQMVDKPFSAQKLKVKVIFF